jgi:hypothetical protein
MPFYIIALVLMLEYRKKRIAARQIRNAEAENCD